MDEHANIRAAVLAIVSDVVGQPVDVVRAQPVLGAHGWDSLAALEGLAQLESRFGVALDLREYNAARVIDDLVAMIGAAGAAKSVTTA